MLQFHKIVPRGTIRTEENVMTLKAIVWADDNGGFTATLADLSTEFHRTKRHASLEGAQHAMRVWVEEQAESPVPVVRRAKVAFKVLRGSAPKAHHASF